MTTLIPIEPKQRIEILDVLRGFALLGIIFNNILYFSGYSFVPFDALRRFPILMTLFMNGFYGLEKLRHNYPKEMIANGNGD